MRAMTSAASGESPERSEGVSRGGALCRAGLQLI